MVLLECGAVGLAYHRDCGKGCLDWTDGLPLDMPGLGLITKDVLDAVDDVLLHSRDALQASRVG
jgi:hypothetical protein